MPERIARENPDTRLAGGTAVLAFAVCLSSESSVRFEFVSNLPNEFNSSLYIYLRNYGRTEARVLGINLNGVNIEEFKVVSWHRIRPGIIQPGNTSEILIRFHGRPQRMNLAIETDLGGEVLEREISISREKEPFQINFIGFSSDLRTVFVYLQNNRWMLKGRKTPYHIERVFVNGKGVTGSTKRGAGSLEGTVIPLEVSLGSPLERGEPAVVTIAAAEGVNAGLALRAFPSEFPVQACFFNHIHPDPVREIWKNCFTAASFRFKPDFHGALNGLVDKKSLLSPTPPLFFPFCPHSAHIIKPPRKLENTKRLITALPIPCSEELHTSGEDAPPYSQQP